MTNPIHERIGAGRRGARLAAIAAACCLLAACGGGGDDDELASGGNRVPDSAMSSVAALTAFVKAMSESDDAEPLTMNGAEAPTTDADEPLAAA